MSQCVDCNSDCDSGELLLSSTTPEKERANKYIENRAIIATAQVQVESKLICLQKQTMEVDDDLKQAQLLLSSD